MGSLVVVGFPKAEEAEQVRRELVDIQREQLIALEDAVVVEHDSEGQVHLRQAINLTAAGALGGGFWGTLVGLLFLNPLLGAAVGAGVGAASGSLSDIGINDGFMRELGETLPRGSAALCLLVREATPDRGLSACAPMPPTPSCYAATSATPTKISCGSCWSGPACRPRPCAWVEPAG